MASNLSTLLDSLLSSSSIHTFHLFLLLLICSINQLTQHLSSWFPLRFFTFHSSLQDFFQHAFTPHHMPYPVLFPTMNLFHYPLFFFHSLQDVLFVTSSL